MIRFFYFFRTALENLTRNPILNLVATVTISLAILIMGAFLLLYNNLHALVESSTKGLQVSLYLKDGLSLPAIDRIKHELTGLSGVKSIKFISREEALAGLKKRLGQQGGILDGLDENPLPASFDLEVEGEYLRDRKVEPLIDKVKSISGVDEVRYAWEWAEKLQGVLRVVRMSGYILGGMLLAAIVFIIANTIKLTVLARQEELDIMRLVGATEWFIRTPFYIEGLLQGLAGSLIALSVLWGGFQFLATRIQWPMGLAIVTFTFMPISWSWLLAAIGPLLGLLGSLISLGRFLQR
ncbi:MAG: ABC transporter permease [Deltaproteobacteria bacterium]|nr:ABC transporter permease [Deltaproteobacteria bacterium]